MTDSVENVKFMIQCPHFQRCNAPKCPLDPLVNRRVVLPGEAKCTLKKEVRLKVGFSLPNQGKTDKELSGEKIWASRKQKSQEKTLNILNKKKFRSVKN